MAKQIFLEIIAVSTFSITVSFMITVCLRSIFEKPKRTKKNQCSICLEEMKNNQGLDNLPCDHTFHESCLDKWYFSRVKQGYSTNKITCPLCRKECRVKCIIINYIPTSEIEI